MALSELMGQETGTQKVVIERGPVRVFADQGSLWRAAAEALEGVEHPVGRIFPQGGLTYCPERGTP